MATKQQSRRHGHAPIWVIAALLGVIAMSDGRADSFELRAGVLVDMENGRLYLMSPDSQVEAVDFSNGQQLWSNTDAAKPLAESDGMLVCQAETPAEPNNLRLVVLDVQGQQLHESTVALPPQVVASIDGDMTSRFSVRAVASAGDSLVSWDYYSFPMRGMISAPDEDDEAEQPALVASPPQTSGTLLMNLRSGAMAPVEPQDVPAALLARPPEAEAAAADSSQRLSADGRHTLRSEQVADDREWEKYRWSIIDNESGEEVGQLSSYLSQSPFVLVGSRIIFETGPYTRLIDSIMVEQPLVIQMVDLETGEQVWSRPVRDTTYRGALPP